MNRSRVRETLFAKSFRVREKNRFREKKQDFFGGDHHGNVTGNVTGRTAVPETLQVTLPVFHVPAEKISEIFLEIVFSRARENFVQTNSQASEICLQCMFSNKIRLKVRSFRILKMMSKIMRYV